MTTTGSAPSGPETVAGPSVRPCSDGAGLWESAVCEALGVDVGAGLAPVSRLEKEQEVKVNVMTRAHKALREDMLTA